MKPLRHSNDPDVQVRALLYYVKLISTIRDGRGGSSKANRIVNDLKRWIAGDDEDVWQDGLKCVKKPKRKSHQAPHQASPRKRAAQELERKFKRAESQIDDGELGKAFSTLKSSGCASPTEFVKCSSCGTDGRMWREWPD